MLNQETSETPKQCEAERFAACPICKKNLTEGICPCGVNIHDVNTVSSCTKKVLPTQKTPQYLSSLAEVFSL
jgi:hypothetical protein